ncbi:hypothetical protein GWC94_07150 [Sediminibacterium sp. WSJ-3]|nr:hypothetical protein [Sediminibacterium soli]
MKNKKSFLKIISPRQQSGALQGYSNLHTYPEKPTEIHLYQVSEITELSLAAA